jgi:hypothetical protein
MASGLSAMQWNNADVDDPSAVDVDALRAWYAARSVPWGVRVPAGMPWGHGPHLFRKRLMGLSSASFVPKTAVRSVALSEAGPDDLDAVVAVDAAAFGTDPALTRAWMAPLLGAAAAATVLLAHRGGAILGTGYALRSDGRAGPASLLAGVCAVPGADRDGIADALIAGLARSSFDAGAQLVHVTPDDDREATSLNAFGFVEVDGLDVYAMDDLG